METEYIKELRTNFHSDRKVLSNRYQEVFAKNKESITERVRYGNRPDLSQRPTPKWQESKRMFDLSKKSLKKASRNEAVPCSSYRKIIYVNE